MRAGGHFPDVPAMLGGNNTERGMNTNKIADLDSIIYSPFSRLGLIYILLCVVTKPHNLP